MKMNIQNAKEKQYQNLWDAGKASPKEKFTALKAYNRKQNKLQINNTQL